MIRTSLDTLVILSAAGLLLIAALGGIDMDLGVARLRLYDWTRPLALLTIAASARAVMGLPRRPVRGRPTSHESGSSEAAKADAITSYVATRAMLALLIATACVYAQYQIRVAGGLDSYGYVSAARLLSNGRLSETQPLAALLPFENPMSAAAPLGHVPSVDGTRSVPRFPLGLPIVMSVFTIFGPRGPFHVPLAMAYVAIGLAYLIGRNRGPGTAPDQVAGLLTAVLVAVDPLFAAYAIQPMSDVPATCWLLAAIWALERGRPRPLLAGVCAGMTLLTRPALLPAVIVLILPFIREKRFRCLFGAVAVFVALQIALNRTLYGGVTASGYGPASLMFELSASHLAATVSNFGKWLTYSHTPLFWLLWPGAMFILRRDRWAWQLSAVAAAAVAPYLFYVIFDDWESPRFILPAIALLTILSVRAVSGALGLPRRSSGAAKVGAMFIAFGCAIASHQFLDRQGIYQLSTLEAKYSLVGEWFKRNTSERVVVLAGLHSGSIRLYGDRATIRWDQIPDHSLAATVRSLIGAGYEPYLALDLPTEPPLFQKRFITQGLTSEQVARVRVVNIYKFMSVY